MTDDLTRKGLARAIDAAGIEGAEILDRYPVYQLGGQAAETCPAIVLRCRADAFAFLAALGYTQASSGETDPDDLIVIAGRTRLDDYEHGLVLYWPGLVLAGSA
jgi:hypothetical protein